MLCRDLPTTALQHTTGLRSHNNAANHAVHQEAWLHLIQYMYNRFVTFTVQDRVKTPPEIVEAEIPAQAMIAPDMQTGRHPNLNC